MSGGGDRLDGEQSSIPAQVCVAVMRPLHASVHHMHSDMTQGCTRRYTGLWERTGENAVITIRPTIMQTLVRFKGVVQAGADIDKVARLHIENGNMPTFYHIFRQEMLKGGKLPRHH